MSLSKPPSDFDEKLRLLQSGDSTAIEQFVAEYEPYIRRAIRFRIRDSALMAAADSVDVCQSVLGGFLLKLSVGDYELQSESDLRGLLVSIARRKFSMLRRRESAAKRCRGRTQSLEDVPEHPSPEPGPAAHIELAELSTRVRELLSSEEWALLEMRRSGLSWSEIEARVEVNSNVLKKRLSRAMHRVAEELGVDL